MKENGLRVSDDITDFENIAGYGIICKIDESEIFLGNSKFLDKYNIQNNYTDDEKELSELGNSIVYIVKNKRILALIGVNDIIRDGSKDVIKELSKKNVQTIMLTGDNNDTAKKIGEELNVSKIIANVLPAEKAEIVDKLKQENKFVMMCGDGINDSPALAKADIGVSIKSGTDIAIDSSDVILTKNDLKSILGLINISKKTVRNIKQNLFWAFFYNILMIPIAAGILKPIGIALNPMLASIAMVLSSLTVIINTLRLKRMKI